MPRLHYTGALACKNANAVPSCQLSGRWLGEGVLVGVSMRQMGALCQATSTPTDRASCRSAAVLRFPAQGRCCQPPDRHALRPCTHAPEKLLPWVPPLLCLCSQNAGQCGALHAGAAPDNKGQGEGEHDSGGCPPDLHDGGLALCVNGVGRVWVRSSCPSGGPCQNTSHCQ
jgi:hypothetical protein